MVELMGRKKKKRWLIVDLCFLLVSFFQMRIIGLEPSSRTYNGYIRALVSVKTFHDGMELVR